MEIGKIRLCSLILIPNEVGPKFVLTIARIDDQELRP